MTAGAAGAVPDDVADAVYDVVRARLDGTTDGRYINEVSNAVTNAVLSVPEIVEWRRKAALLDHINANPSPDVDFDGLDPLGEHSYSEDGTR